MLVCVKVTRTDRQDKALSARRVPQVRPDRSNSWNLPNAPSLPVFFWEMIVGSRTGCLKMAVVKKLQRDRPSGPERNGLRRLITAAIKKSSEMLCD